MVIATGVNKITSFKKQTGLAAPASGSGGTIMRRTDLSLDLEKATFKSNEILPAQQIQDLRHGIRSVKGSLKAELSVGGFQKIFESILRQAVQTAATTGALTNVTAAVTVAPAGTFTRAAGSYLTDGFKIGDIINWTGWATTGTANNNHYMMITALTGTVMTCIPLDGVSVGAKASGDSVTCTLPGKKTWVPLTAQTRDYYTLEEWYSDISQSELYTDCVFSGANVALPSSGMATVEFPIMGLGFSGGASQILTSPSAANSGNILAGVNGILVVNGTKYGTITDLSIKVDGGYTAPGGTLGGVNDPDIFPGRVDVSGQFTVFFDSATLRDLFVNETEFSIMTALVANTSANPPFTQFVMSRCKGTGASNDDGTQGIKMTIPFQALENINGGSALANLDTTISIQDSAFS